MTRNYQQLSLLEQPKINLAQNLYNTARTNIGETGAGLAKAGKATLGAAKTGAKFVGRALPWAGASITGYDAIRSFQIANELEEMRQLYPQIPKEAVDFYRNKGKAISAGAGIGGLGGGVLGNGVFSAPGAAIGIGVGGMAGGGLYNLFQLGNKYADYYNSPEFKKLKQEYYGTNKSSGSDNNKNNGQANSSKSNKTTGYGVANIPQLTGGVSIIGQQPNNTTSEQQSNIDVINNYVQQLKNINKPYIDALNNYYNNYNDMLDKRQRAARFWQGAASLTGNPAWAKLGEQYNPLTQKANKVALIKQIQDAEAGDINAINEVMGNMALAKEMDLPYEAAFANKNLLTALTANRRNLTDWEKAQLAAELKRYGIDVGYSKAMNQQALRNKGALDVALTNAAAFGGGYQPAPGLTQQGQARPPMAINQVQSQNDIASLFPPKK